MRSLASDPTWALEIKDTNEKNGDELSASLDYLDA